MNTLLIFVCKMMMLKNHRGNLLPFCVLRQAQPRLVPEL